MSGAGNGAPRYAERDGAAVLRLARMGGCPATALVVTENRRVMASLGAGGRTLRVHRAFLRAPDEVLYAVGILFSRARSARRRMAGATVQAFIRTIPGPAEPPRSRTRRLAPPDAEPVRRLYEEFDRVNAEVFAGALPRVPIFLSGRMRRRNGHFSAAPLEIVLSRRLCLLGAEGEAEATLRHEMIHLWQHASGRAVNHGTEFRAMARLLDVHPRALRDVRWRTRPAERV